MKDLFFALGSTFIVFALASNLVTIPSKVLELSVAGCGSRSNVQWIRVGIGGWGFGCYTPAEE